MFFFFSFLALPCGMQDLSSLTRNPACTPTLKVWRPNHWASREVPCFTILSAKSTHPGILHLTVPSAYITVASGGTEPLDITDR